MLCDPELGPITGREEIRYLKNTETPLSIAGHFIKIASLPDEFDFSISDPVAFIDRLKSQKTERIDIFTFTRSVYDKLPLFDYDAEWFNLAVLEYKDYQYWFEHILDDKTRNMVRKAGKKGVEIRVTEFNDEFVRGIVEIYNETPVRQGRPFKHYGKTFEQTRDANATHLERSEFLGAYSGSELIGFIKLTFGDRTARAEQIISKIAHRDKAPTNALLAEAVRCCEKRGLPYLIYGSWPAQESFAQFKKNNGFTKVRLPRYYVALTAKGQLAIKLGWHRGLKDRIPESVRDKLVMLRERWYDLKGKLLKKE